MKCPNCGNDLPENISFCPYCMVKFNEDNEQEKNTKKHSKLPIVIGASIVLIVLITVVVIFSISGGKNGENNNTDKENKTDAGTDLNVENKEETFNPVEYCGTWYNSEFDGESPELEGGNVLKIISMTGDKVIFDLSSYQAPPNSRIAEITGIEADIENGQAEFIFGNDGWGNGGIGTILFLDGEIYVNIKLTTVSSESLWGIGTDIKFKKVSDTCENDNIDFMGTICENIEIVKTMLKLLPYELIEIEPDEIETEYIYRCGGITIGAIDDSITFVNVDYTQFPEGYRKILNFSFGINGSADFEYMKSKLGEPINTFEEDGTYISIFNAPEDRECYLEVTYSAGEVISIKYFAIFN